ncbi:MAG: hypothetical protein II273_04410, partial [Lachnospiraceae bacterium]|nr:hypothetical protein [Lachnospiraceae bacterium]
VKASATKLTDSSDDGKRIGLLTMGQTVYIASYADSSTPAKPIVKIGGKRSISWCLSAQS